MTHMVSVVEELLPTVSPTFDLFVKPFIFNRKAHAVKQDSVQGLCISGQILKPLLLKKSLWNAEERK